MKEYKGYKIKKEYYWKTNRKMWTFWYGRGSSKTRASYDKINLCKLFIDLLEKSDYGTIHNDKTTKLRHKYHDELIRQGYKLL